MGPENQEDAPASDRPAQVSERGAQVQELPVRRGRATFDAADPDSSFRFGARDLWRILVTWDGVPAAYRELADPGKTASSPLTDTALRQAGELGIAGSRLRRELERRLGVRRPVGQRPTCTIVLCTHRRPEMARQAIDALARLDPPADEVVVVDSDPGAEDVQAATEAAEFRYVREDLRGQNRARAIGLQLATSEIVAYTDDDVVVSPGWLEPLGELFADPSVAGATGAAFGRRLDTRAQNLRESFAGFVPALDRRSFDWTNLRAVSSGAAGAGASMMFRRQVLVDLADVFPPELDGGTPTRSAGDVYAMYRVLVAGHRIVFDPRIHAEHEHPAGDEALRQTVLGYGTGYSAFLTKALIAHGEFEALRAWWWLAGQLLSALAWEGIYPHPGHLNLRSNYLRGGFRGPLALLRSVRQERSRRPSAARGQGAAAAVDDPLPAPSTSPEEVAIIRASGTAERNRAVSESSGAILLFADPDLEAPHDLAERHGARHRTSDQPRIVIGYTETSPENGRLAAQLHALWCRDHQTAARTAPRLTFADMTVDNFSMPRSVFERLGGFDEKLEPESAARELALRALAAGIAAEYEPRARAKRVSRLDTQSALDRAQRAGADHARVAALHPVAAGVLPATVGPCHAPTPSRAVRLLPWAALRPIGVALAGVLEAGRFRRVWLRLFKLLFSASYMHGFIAAGGRPTDGPRLELDITSGDPIPAPAVAAPLVDVRAGDLLLRRRLRPPRGQWGASLATEALEKVDSPFWRRGARIPSLVENRTARVDVLGAVVVFGPASRSRDSKHADEFARIGARVECLAGSRKDHWNLIAEFVSQTEARLVAIPLPGVCPRAEWLEAACVPLTGDRVGAVCGAGIPTGAPVLPTELVSRSMFAGAYRPVGSAPQFLIVDTAQVARVGGIDPSTARLGHHGPVLDLIERLLAAGRVVAAQETSGLEPAGGVQPARLRWEGQRAIARGGLVARAAAETGGLRGAMMLAAHMLVRPLFLLWPASRFRIASPLMTLAVLPFELLGCLRVLARPFGRPARRD